MDYNIIISFAGTLLGVFITICTMIIKCVKNSKAKTVAEQVLKISQAVLPYIEQAEKFTAYSGEEKKAFVMTRANQFAIENHIEFDYKQVSEKVEELVTLTKQVNTKTTNASETNESDKNTDSSVSWL